MEPNLERLIRLQEFTLALDDLAKKFAAIPGRSQDLEQTLARARADLAKTRDDLAGLQKDRRKLEGDLASVEVRISKYQQQLMDVKTNKEYTAMLHEIEAVKTERESIETKILVEMEAAEATEKAIREKEKFLASEQRRVEAGLATLAEEREEIEARKTEQEAGRKESEAALPGDLVAEFTKVLRGRAGLAVVRVIAGLCQGCSVRIQPRIFQQVRRNDSLVRCETCRRYLYYVEEKRAEPAPGA